MLTQNMIAPFSVVQKEFTENFKKLVKGVDFLFVVDVTKEELWDTYLNSFPEEDGIRQSFNCNACKSFIRKFGGVVAIKGSKFS